MTLPRTPAVLQAETTTETDYGGRTSAWAEAVRLWVTLTPAAPRPLAAGDASPARLESASAEARDDARAARGQQLLVEDEPPWTVMTIDRDHPKPGRMTLRLERAA